jgi:mono/diheme cytochrome c family protein
VYRHLIRASFCLSASILLADPETEVTFHKDVLPILQNRCQGCHRPGEAAPMAFLTYSDTRPWASAIRQAVQTGKMPPWHADPAYGHFLNDRRLSQMEKDTLVEWTKTGAKEGDPTLAPLPRQFTQRWTIGQPDLVLDMGADY